MPRVGSKHSIVSHAADDPARDRHLLLVAAREAPHLVAGARVDLQGRDALVDLAFSPGQR